MIRSINLVCAAQLDDFPLKLDWSPDGSSLAAVTVSGECAVIDASTGAWQGRALEAHPMGALDCAWAPDSRTWASSGQDGKLRVWRKGESEATQVLAAGAPWVAKVVFADTGLASGAGKVFRVTSLSGEVVFEDRFDHTISDMVFLPKRDAVLAVAAYNRIRTFDVARREWLADYEAPAAVMQIAPSRNGKFLAVGCQNNSVHFWDLGRNDDFRMGGYPGAVTGLSWSPDSSYLMTAAGDLGVLWDFRRGPPENQQPGLVKTRGGQVRAVQFASTMPVFAVASTDGDLRFFGSKSTSRVLGGTNLEEPCAGVAWSPDDRRIAVWGEAGRVRVFEVVPA